MNTKSLVLLAASVLFTIQCSGPQKKPGAPETIAAEDAFHPEGYGIERAPAAAKQKYKPGKELCGGYPALGMTLPAGLCAGLVFDGSETFKMARGAIPYKDTVFVLDMGGWGANAGSLWRLDKGAGGLQAKRLLGPTDLGAKDKKLLDRPSGMLVGPDGMIYVGAAGTIWKFSPEKAKDTATLKTSIKRVIDNMVAAGLHPLKHFVFENANTLVVNQGAQTDHCSSEDPGYKMRRKTCHEAIKNGALYRYTIKADGSYTIKKIATGLRNSMALAIDPRSGILYQGENSRDAIQKADPSLDGNLLPHEEINRIEEGGNYGWPFCYDDGAVSPEFEGHADCSGFNLPIALLPAHSAPLGMIFYRGKMLPAWYQNKMLITLHGYVKAGHRLAAVEVDTEGRLVGKPYEFMGGWGESPTQPKGAPVGIVEAGDGSLWITEDKNGTIVRIFYDASKGDGIPKLELKDDGSTAPIDDIDAVEKRRRAMEERLNLPNPPTFTLFQKEIIDTSCLDCHGGQDAAEPKLLKHDDIGNAENIRAAGLVSGKDFAKSQIYTSIFERRMPKGDFDAPTEEEKKAMYTRATTLLKKWIEQGAP